MAMGWEIKLNSGADPLDCTVTDWPIHIMPVDDFREHEIDVNCWCKPKFKDDNTLIVHNSLDERESYERGERMVQ